MALEIFYFRHAQSVVNVTFSQYIGGRSNASPLTYIGEKQADLLGERFNWEKISFSEVYSSPALRTKMTAERSCKFTFPLERIVYVDAIQELDQGEWEGRQRTEIYTPEMLEIINSDNWNFKAPGGESQKEVEDRHLSWVNGYLLPRSKEDLKIAIYGHGIALSCFLRGIMGFNPSLTYKIKHNNTGLTRLKYSDDGWHVLCVNDTSHLPFTLRT